SPPTRKTDTPNSMVNRVRILSEKKTSVTHRPIRSAWVRSTGGRASAMVSSTGHAKEMALTARMPRMAQPLSMSRLWMRSFAWTGPTAPGATAIVASLVMSPPMQTRELYTNAAVQEINSRQPPRSGLAVADQAETVAHLRLGPEGDEGHAQT